MNTMWIAITVIAVAGIIAGVMKDRSEAKGGKEAMAAIEDLQKRVDEMNTELRDRVETLERIVTDDQESLKRKIDAL